MIKSSRGMACAGVLFLSSVSLPAVAAAQVSEIPERELIDANGVNVSTGKYRVERSDFVVGSGAGKLEIKRLAGQSIFKYAYVDLGMIPTVGGRVRVSVGERTFAFNHGVGNSFQSALGDGATLTRVWDNLTLTDSGGTTYKFSHVVTPDADNQDQRKVYLSEIISPNGAKMNINWDISTYSVCREWWPDPSMCQYEDGYSEYKHFSEIRLESISNNAGYTANFNYAEPSLWGEGAIENWHKNTGVTSSNAHSTAGQMPSVSISSTFQTLPSGHGLQTEEVTDALGRTTRYNRETTWGWRYEAIKEPGSSVDNFRVYSDGAFRVTSVVRNGSTWTYSYAEPYSGTSTLIVTNPAGKTRKYTSNLAVGLPTEIEDEYGRKTIHTYDALGRLSNTSTPDGQTIHYNYDGNGNVTSRHLAAAGGAGTISTSATYPSSCSGGVTCSLPTSTTDGRGVVTNYSYDPVHGGILSATVQNPNASSPSPGVQTRYSQVSGVWMPTKQWSCRTQSACESAADAVQSMIAYNANLLPISITQGSGDGSLAAATGFTYTAAGDVATVDGPLTGAADTTRYNHNATRQLTQAVDPDPDGAGALRSRSTVLHYDGSGRSHLQEVGSANADGSGFVSNQQVGTQFDSSGRPAKKSLTSGGTVYSVTQYAYDPFGRTTCVATRMDPNQWAGQSDACTPQTSGANGPDRVARVEYFDDGRTKKVTSAYGTLEATDESLTYTPGGRVLTITDGNGNVTTNGYDGFGRLLTTTFPGGSYEQLTYDNGDNVTQRRLRDGQVINYGYDYLSRLVSNDRPNGTWWETDHTYAFDLIGNLTSATDSNGHSLTYSYDALGRQLTQASNWYGTVASSWDLAGRRTALSWPDSFWVSYNYLVTGEMSAVREYGATSGPGVLALYGYDDLRRRTSITRGNGTITSYGYDAVSRLATLSDDLAGSAHDVVRSFTFNPAGQIASSTRSNDAYAWVGHANVDRNYGVNGLNQLTSSGGTSLSYDGRGNLTSSGGSAYGYTADNQLATSPATAFAYDPLGRLFHRSQVAGDFVYDGTAMIEEINTSGPTRLRRHVYGAGMDEPLVWYEGSGTGDRRWLHADERGSIVAVSNGSGVATNINTYDEYGIPGVNNAGRFQYTGQMWLPELGMYHYKARTYSPSLGRFMQTDPIGYSDGMNLYNYVGSDPINSTDPTGLERCFKMKVGGSVTYDRNNLDGPGTITAIMQEVCFSDRGDSLGPVRFGASGKSKPQQSRKLSQCSVRIASRHLAAAGLPTSGLANVRTHSGLNGDANLFTRSAYRGGSSVTQGNNIYKQPGITVTTLFEEISHTAQFEKYGTAMFYLTYGAASYSAADRGEDMYEQNFLERQAKDLAAAMARDYNGGKGC